jgi:endonuclease/exonuclease/phosphatase family metal-dependent hydrolase
MNNHPDKSFNSSLFTNISWLYFIIIIINTLFGLQLLVSFFSLLVNFFRERPSITLFHVAIYALVTFLLVLPAGFLFRVINKRALFITIFLSVSVARLIIQICRWAPLSLVVSALGTILWIISFVFLISLAQQRKIRLFFTFFPALVFGFALYSGLNGIFGTWDMIWRLSHEVILTLIALVAMQTVIVFSASESIENDRIYSDGSGAVFYSIAAYLPFVFLQLYRFQNIAAFNAITGFGIAFSLILIILSNILALVFTYFIEKKILRVLLTVAFAILFIISFWPEITGALYFFQILSGNIAGWWLLLILLNRAVSRTSVKVPWKNTYALTISGVLLFIFAFIYYGSYDLTLPLKSWMIPVAAAVMIAVFSLVSVFNGFSLRKLISAGTQPGNNSGQYIKESFFKRNISKYLSVILMLLLFIIPAILLIPAKSKAATNVYKDSVRVMHYNVHQGFNINGYQDLESIARVIEKNDADIVCLNEVSRGWVINGSADVYAWLLSRLGMEHNIFMPASDLIWGNAILSRYPLNLIKSGFLPRMDAPLRRSFVYVNVNLSGTGVENINLMSTHLHHIEGESEKRQAQVKALLEEWGGFGRTVICGDFNAVTGDKEIDMLKQAGLIDSQLALGKQDELTWIFYEPYGRIDYIWVTPDIDISNLNVTYSRASDHLPVSLEVK